MLGPVRVHPVVGRAYILFVWSADKREVFGAGDIIGAAAVQVTVRVALLVQLERRVILQHLP